MVTEESLGAVLGAYILTAIPGDPFTPFVAEWSIILGLALGGIVAAPMGAWACKRIPVKLS